MTEPRPWEDGYYTLGVVLLSHGQQLDPDTLPPETAYERMPLSSDDMRGDEDGVNNVQYLASMLVRRAIRQMTQLEAAP